ncbi:long-chain-fatty-acid--CoA ligase [Dimargaris cristalligena]|uniref:Long-chain-fatty-acid--CoA ligase n=1 Tax=Dimargaris cristalligena TaxID=215637 RepID=A0A4P9ZZR5_9FUNG|nr:long-chain-fatty-acid--CoA ligase [Dimargaris cristalligena]|eukprot:RKP39286.1 long-chain-fatty-acid--CoA ligase [Dimargaris cristalligena]
MSRRLAPTTRLAAASRFAARRALTPGYLSPTVLHRSLTITPTRPSGAAEASVAASSSAPFTSPEPTALRLSHVKGDAAFPLQEYTLGEAFDRQVELFPDSTAIVVSHENARLTYQELAREVDQMAQALYDHGLRPGDCVGVFMPNTLAWMVLQYATTKIGVILATINPAYRVGELEHALNLVNCKTLVLTPSFRSSNYINMIQELVPEVAQLSSPAPNGEGAVALQSARVPSLRSIFVVDESAKSGAAAGPEWRHLPGLADYQTLRHASHQSATRAAIAQLPLRNSDVANILFTSGTTGKPKAAALTHRNLLNNALLTAHTLGYTHRDVVCCPLPLYHCFGLVLGNLACMTQGATMVFPSPVFEAQAVLTAVTKERCTSLYGVPTMFIEEMAHPDFASFDLSSLRTGIMSGSSCPIEVMREVIEKMHMREVVIGYGMTETSPISFFTRRDDPIEKRVSTVGRVVSHVEAKIIDAATGATLPTGEKGELCINGSGVMQGYWNDPVNTAKSIDGEGWMHTGDLAIMDPDGFCRIVGRSKDVIIRGGENIMPLEIENVLFEHPAISNVLVVGVPDAKYGEQICACVIPVDSQTPVTLESIKDFCRDKMSHYKMPRYTLTFHEFPQTVSGKIKRNELSVLAAEQLQLKK